MRQSQLTNCRRNLFSIQSQQTLQKNKQNQDFVETQFLSQYKKNAQQRSLEYEMKRNLYKSQKLSLEMNRKYIKKYLTQKSNQKYVVKQILQKNKLRSTFSKNNYFTKAESTGILTFDKNKNRQLTILSNIRKSFNPSQKFKIQQQNEKNTQYSQIQSKLNILSDKIINAKKQLQKKKQKRLKQEQQKCIIQKEQQQYQQNTFKDQQSEISNSESINTVKINRNLRISSLVTRMPRLKNLKGFNYNPYSPRKFNKYYISQIIRAKNEKNSIARQHINSSIKILKQLQNEYIPSYSQIQEKKLNLIKKQFYKDKKTLIFDLDQTLIHCIQNIQNDCDVKLPIMFTSGQTVAAGINIRPYSITLLNQLCQNFQIMIFTASHSCYANAVLDYLDPNHKIFQHRLYRQHCYLTESGMYIKDLRIINRNLCDMVLIDNAAYSYYFQLENGIPIIPYYQGTNDYELKELKLYLQKLKNTKDVRQVNKNTFKLHEYTRFIHSQELIEQLYMKN